MSAYRTDATLTEDGTITLDDLPFHAGESVEIIIVSRVAQPSSHTNHPLRGKVIRYDNPTEPVAQEEWEALQ
jgi:hypothetical protein